MYYNYNFIALHLHLQLHDVVEYKKTGSKNLFMKCRLQVCNFLAEAMHDIQLSQMEKMDDDNQDVRHIGGKTAEEILMKVSKVLGFENTKTFLTVSVWSPLGLLVSSADSFCKQFVSRSGPTKCRA